MSRFSSPYGSATVWGMADAYRQPEVDKFIAWLERVTEIKGRNPKGEDTRVQLGDRLYNWGKLRAGLTFFGIVFLVAAVMVLVAAVAEYGGCMVGLSS